MRSGISKHRVFETCSVAKLSAVIWFWPEAEMQAALKSGKTSKTAEDSAVASADPAWNEEEEGEEKQYAEGEEEEPEQDPPQP